MYIEEQIDKIIDVLNEIKGYTAATNDFNSKNNSKPSQIIIKKRPR